MRGLNVAFGLGVVGFMIALGVGISAHLSAVMVAVLMGVVIGALVTAPTVALVMWIALRAHHEAAHPYAPMPPSPVRPVPWSAAQPAEPAPPFGFGQGLLPQPRRFYVIGESGEVTELSAAESDEEVRW